MKTVLISWSINESKPKSSFILFGEVNSNHIDCLREDIKYLYPFKLSKNQTPYNISDFLCLQKKYEFTSPKIIGNITEKIFHSPQIYDLETMKPLFKSRIPKKVEFTESKHRFFIVLPYVDPILRGKILDSCLCIRKDYDCIFILIGGKEGLNMTSTNTLMKRYLLKQGIDSVSIIKSETSDYPDCIIDSVCLLNMMYEELDYVYIACSTSQVTQISLFIRENRDLLECSNFRFITD